jgi:hypothetical protein
MYVDTVYYHANMIDIPLGKSSRDKEIGKPGQVATCAGAASADCCLAQRWWLERCNYEPAKPAKSLAPRLSQHHVAITPNIAYSLGYIALPGQSSTPPLSLQTTLEQLLNLADPSASSHGAGFSFISTILDHIP